MSELWLVRHGQTDWNLERRYQGHSDTPLNATGLEQAALAAASLTAVSLTAVSLTAVSLTGRRYAAIYSSDLRRVRTTAEIIGQVLGMEVILDPRLREVNFGVWEGMLAADIEARYPVEWEARRLDLQHVRPPGGESVQDVADRIWPAIDELSARHSGAPLILVSHGLALATVLCRVQDAPLASARSLIPDNAQARCVEWERLAAPLAL